MPYSMSSARMSIDTCRDEVGGDGEGMKRVESADMSQVTRHVDLTNFQRGNFSEQSILHLTSMEHLSFFISLC